MLNQSNAAPATPAVFERVFRKIEAAQPDADPNSTREMELLWLRPDVQRALQGVLAEFLRLTSSAGNLHHLQIARERAEDSSPETIVATLNAMRESLAAERDVVRAELAIWGAGHAAARLKTRNHELAADEALRRAEAQLLFVRGRLKAAPEEQVSSKKKLRDAGYSEADIARIGVKPTASEIEAWTADVETLTVQIERIKTFFAGRPHYDVSILQDDDLATLSKWQARLPETNVLGYRGAS